MLINPSHRSQRDSSKVENYYITCIPPACPCCHHLLWFSLKLFGSSNEYSQCGRHSSPPPVSSVYLLFLFSGPLTLPSVRLFIPLCLVSCSLLHMHLHFPFDWFGDVICAKISTSYILINSNLFFIFGNSKIRLLDVFSFILFLYII